MASRSSQKKKRKIKLEIEVEPEYQDTKPEKKLTDDTDEFKVEGQQTSDNINNVGVPENWIQVLENIRQMQISKGAPVNTMDCENTVKINISDKVKRYQTLVSLMLSSQTKDQVTDAAMQRLHQHGLDVQRSLDINETELSELIKPVRFCKKKAVYIKRTAQILRENYEDDIPKTYEELCKLPGVGPKMAVICLHVVWGINAGIGVDTHVHRVANRLMWTGSKKTNTAEQTRAALESWVPKDLWREVDLLLVGFGQAICSAVKPKCNECLNKNICPSSTAKISP